MKKRILTSLGAILVAASLAGCTQKQEAKQEQSSTQENKLQISNEEIVKEAIGKFFQDKNMELDTQTTANLSFLGQEFSTNMVSNIKIDDNGNILKKYSSEEQSSEGNSSENEDVFLKKVGSSYEAYDVVGGKLVPADDLSDELSTISGIKGIFDSGNSILASAKDKEYKVSGNELIFTSKIKVTDITSKLYLDIKDILPVGEEGLANGEIPLTITIDINTKEVRTIEFNLKELISEGVRAEFEKEKSSMGVAEAALAESMMNGVLEKITAKTVLTRKIDKIEEIKFN